MSVMGMTIYDFLRRAASLHATSNAVVHDGGTLTYPELLGRVDQLANGFAHLGLAHGARVCVLAQNHLEYFELYFACAKLGLIVYPINWRLSATEIGHVLTRAEPNVMVFDQSMAALTAGPGPVSKTSRTGSSLPPIDNGWISSDGLAPAAIEGQISSMWAPSTFGESGSKW